MSRYWRCRRVAAGVRCGELNLATKKKCHACGKLRPKVRKPAHRAVLDEMPYEQWVAMFGEVCGICGQPPKPGRKLDRDHDHATGDPRGLLCGMPCNKFLAGWMTPVWLRRAAFYLEKAHERRAA